MGFLPRGERGGERRGGREEGGERGGRGLGPKRGGGGERGEEESKSAPFCNELETSTW